MYVYVCVHTELFSTDLTKDLDEHLSSWNDLKRVLIALAQGDRDEDIHVDHNKVVEDVNQLIKVIIIIFPLHEEVGGGRVYVGFMCRVFV
jgi:hypothetical protein